MEAERKLFNVLITGRALGGKERRPDAVISGGVSMPVENMIPIAAIPPRLVVLRGVDEKCAKRYLEKLQSDDFEAFIEPSGKPQTL